jgi:hypothetical protein
MIRFIKVGSFLHFMTILSAILCFIAIGICVEQFAAGGIFSGIAWMLLGLGLSTVPFFAEFDAMGRYQNYKQVKDAIQNRGFDHRLLKPFMHSKCQRDAVLVAAEDLGCKKEVSDFYYSQGYRWYHILPDAFLKNPFVLFHGLFWKRILFTRRYELENFYW